MLTIYIGASGAKRIGDAHETYTTNRAASRGDLYNNWYARCWVARNPYIYAYAGSISRLRYVLGVIGRSLYYHGKLVNAT
jgi:hypothetical protein